MTVWVNAFNLQKGSLTDGRGLSSSNQSPQVSDCFLFTDNLMIFAYGNTLEATIFFFFFTVLTNTLVGLAKIKANFNKYSIFFVRDKTYHCSYYLLTTFHYLNVDNLWSTNHFHYLYTTFHYPPTTLRWNMERLVI